MNVKQISRFHNLLGAEMSRRDWVREDRRFIYSHITGDEISVAIDKIRLPSGRAFDYVHVISPYEVVFIVAVDSDMNVCMLRQFRYLIGDDVWEIPGGGKKEDESPEQAARRELAEEAGVSADKLIHIGDFYSSVGITNQIGHIFLASHLSPSKSVENESEVFDIHWFPFSEALSLVLSNEVLNVGAAYGILLAKHHMAARSDGL